MRLKHLSASSTKCWEDHCQFKWCLGYHVKPRIELKENYAANLGTHMHEVFEKIANKELTKENWETWSKKEQPELYDLAKVKYPDCEQIADQVMLDCRMIFNCLFGRDPIFNPLESGDKILGIEKKFEYDIEGIRIKGYIDLVIELDEDTIEVYDYKTGKSAQGYDKAAKDIQVLMYYIAASDMYPSYKHVLVTLDYMQKKPVTIPVAQAHRKQALRRLNTVWRQIEACEAPRRWEEPIWVCKCFCDREVCDNLWDIYQNKCSGDLDKFEGYLLWEIYQNQGQGNPEKMIAYLDELDKKNG